MKRILMGFLTVIMVIGAVCLSLWTAQPASAEVVTYDVTGGQIQFENETSELNSSLLPVGSITGFKTPTARADDIGGETPLLSNNANLTDLSINQGILNPAFDSATYSYTASVTNDVCSISITPTLSDTVSGKVYVNEILAVNGESFGPIELNVGDNTINVTTYAQDGSSKGYVINITRTATDQTSVYDVVEDTPLISDNANLEDLSVNQGVLNPTFDSETCFYEVYVTSDISSINVTPVLSDKVAGKVYVNETLAVSGEAFGPIDLNIGDNFIVVTTYAQDGSSKVYLLTVTSEPINLSSASLEDAVVPEPTVYSSDSVNQWCITGISPISADLKSVVYGNAGYVAVGTSGSICMSEDGVNWFAGNSGTINNLYGITFGNGKYLAVGEKGTIISSSDGLTWATVNSGGFHDLNGVVYGNGKYIAVGVLGTIITSIDGITWTRENAETDQRLSGISFGNNSFTIVGYGGMILTSSNGTIWTQQQSNTCKDLLSLTYGNSGFVAVGRSGTILTSNDGISWIIQQSNITKDILSATYGNNEYVLITSAGTFLNSTDGIVWNITNNAVNATIITYGQFGYVAVGRSSIYLSSDGLTWTGLIESNPYHVQLLYDAAAGNGIYVAVGIDCDLGGIVRFSTDGTTWSDPKCPQSTAHRIDSLRRVFYGNNTFFIPYAGGLYISSDNGLTWEYSKIASDIYSVTYGDSGFICVSANGTVIKSTDCFASFTSKTITSKALYGITFGKSGYVAVGDEGTIMTSSDGVLWKVQTSGTTEGLRSVAYYDGQYIAVGCNGTILTSTNAEEWYMQTSNTIVDLKSVAGGVQGWVVVGDSYTSDNTTTTLYDFMLTSHDGIVWNQPSIDYHYSLKGVTYGDDGFIVVGGSNNSIILKSGPKKDNVPPVFLGTKVTNTNQRVKRDIKIFFNEPIVINKEEVANIKDSITLARDGENFLPLSETETVYISGSGIFIQLSQPLRGSFNKIKITPNAIKDCNDNILTVEVVTESFPYDIQERIWHWRNPLPHGNDINGLTFGSGTFVAVGADGTILTSFDGKAWVERASGINCWYLMSVTHGNGLFIAVGNNGVILTSPDGVEWTQRVSNVSNCLYSVAYGSNGYIAVGAEGIILTSPDGIVWTKQNSGTTNSLLGASSNGGFYVAVGTGGTILTSTDCITWTSQSSGISISINGVVGSDGRFVAVGADGLILYSEDGTAWAKSDSGLSSDLSKVMNWNNGFVALGSSGKIVTSPDGLIWTLAESSCSRELNDVAYGNNYYIAIGKDGTILASQDSNTWMSLNTRIITTNTLEELAYGGGQYIAVGRNGIILTSSNGIDWTNQNSGTSYIQNLFGVTYGNNGYIAVGYGGRILTSPNGIIWTNQNSGITSILYGITYGSSGYVAVGANGIILISQDGTTWTACSSGTSNTLKSVTFNDGKYIAVGYNGTIVMSADGRNWQAQTSGTSWSLEDICSYRGGFVAVGSMGTIVRSYDGASWSPGDVTWSDLSSVCFGDNGFVASGGTTIYSVDGVVWKTEGTYCGGSKVTYGNEGYVTCGSGGKILQLGKTGTDIEPPLYVSVFLDNSSKRCTLSFNEEIVNNTDDLTALKSSIEFSVDGIVYYSLSENDKISFSGSSLVINFENPLIGINNRIKIASNSLKDNSGNVLAQLIITDAISGQILDGPPSVATRPATNIKQTAATLNGVVTAFNVAGENTKEIGFRYCIKGTGNYVTVKAGTTTIKDQVFSANVTELQPGTEYSYYAYAVTETGGEGTATSSEYFTTVSVSPPTVETKPATNIKQTTATLNGVVTAFNVAGENTKEIGFRYCIKGTGNYVPVKAGTTTIKDQDFSAKITGLLPGTEYSYQAYAVTETGGTGWAETSQYFTTSVSSGGGGGGGGGGVVVPTIPQILTPLTVTINTPTADTDLAKGQVVPINAEASGDGTIKFSLYINGVRKVSDRPGSTLNYSWNTSGLTTGKYKIKVEAGNDKGEKVSQEITVNIKDGSIELIKPVNGEEFVIGSPISISADCKGISYVKYYIKNQQTGTVDNPGGRLTGNFSTTWATTNLQEGSYYIHVIGYSANGTLIDEDEATIILKSPVALPTIRVYFNNELLQFDTDPIITNGRIMIPVRPIAEAMGATVEWDQSTQTAVLTLGIKEVRITINEKIAYVDDKPVTLDVPAQVTNGRTLVPLRFIGEGLGAKVDWDEPTKTAYITYKPISSPIIIDGQEMKLSQEPYDQNGCTMVPLREFVDWFDLKTTWDNEYKTATITGDGICMSYTIGAEMAEIDGVAVLSNRAPEIVDNVTFVPLRFICEGLGASEFWDENTKTIYINTKIKSGEKKLAGLSSYVRQLNLQIGEEQAYIPIHAEYLDGSSEELYSGVTWESSNETIVRIDDGVVIPRSEGEATIWGVYDNFKTLPILIHCYQ